MSARLVRPTVIISTYNHPRWLEKTLWGYTVQTRQDFELVVADDGSGPETLAVIDRFRAESGREVLHVWHEDRGFRKTEILNRAILASSGDYIIFTDGDCIPRDDFVEMHTRLARPGHFISGTAIRLTMALSERITVDDVRSRRITDTRWLWAQGWRDVRRIAKLVRQPVVTWLFDLTTNLPARFDGGNVSTWRDLLVAVNGFDMDMVWGDEDRSLGLRLQHMGVRGLQARNRVVVLHLEHGRPYVNEESLRHNRAIVERIRRDREVRAPRGLVELRAQLAAAGEEPAHPHPHHTPQS